jgi:hypothetical protein
MTGFPAQHACCETALFPNARRIQMSKTGRKRRSRKKKSANHGKRPNA